MAKIGVVGTGTWGTTLAIVMARQGHGVCLWTRTEDEANQLRSAGQHTRFVPGVSFPSGLTITASASEAFSEADLIIIAVPSRTLRENVCNIRDSISESAVVVSCTKGLEFATGKRMSRILEEELPASLQAGICALAGPNLAREVVEERPASTVIASNNADAAKTAQE
ncbi:MAG: NAD(P)-binding domain-containing protein, partial [Chloroflexi bacterium]|nr:NAD(P)-binding domain-containing protein [Chloroflexota bacterium]